MDRLIDWTLLPFIPTCRDLIAESVYLVYFLFSTQTVPNHLPRYSQVIAAKLREFRRSMPISNEYTRNGLLRRHEKHIDLIQLIFHGGILRSPVLAF